MSNLSKNDTLKAVGFRCYIFFNDWSWKPIIEKFNYIYTLDWLCFQLEIVIYN